MGASAGIRACSVGQGKFQGERVQQHSGMHTAWSSWPASKAAPPAPRLDLFFLTQA